MKLKTGVWVVVADGGHGIVFENVGETWSATARFVAGLALPAP